MTASEMAPQTPIVTASDPSALVAVIGAGPVGLSMANELSWRGIPNILIEQRTEPLDFPTSESVHTRTMELFRRWGLAAKIRNSGFPQDLDRNVLFVTTLTGHILAKVHRPSNRKQLELNSAISPEGALWCPKFLLDRILTDGLAEQRETQVMLGWQMIDFRQEHLGVMLSLRRVSDNEPWEIFVRYLAACDGASSPTRKLLGVKMEGSFAERRNLGIYFKSSQLAEIMGELGGVMANILNPDFQGNLTFVDGKNLWRLSFFDPKREASELDPLECIERAVGKSVDVELLDAHAWAGHSAVASHFRKGNVFLLGDAANLRWPNGGFGMNTGVGDVLNLGWKIEANLKGWGHVGLLDSYEAERRPIAQSIVREASGNFRGDGAASLPPMIVDGTPEAEALRKEIGSSIIEKRSREWNTIGIQLGQVYQDSPINIEDGSAAPQLCHDVYVPTTRPGGRAPHVWLEPAQSILDLFGAGFCLVHRGSDDVAPARLREAAEAANIPLRSIALTNPAHQAVYASPFVLVRPDGVVCWRGDNVPEDCTSFWRTFTGSAAQATDSI